MKSLFISIALVFATIAHATTPVVVSDLDETLIDSSTRRLLSFRDAMTEQCGTERRGDCAKVAGINIEEIQALSNRYDFGPLFDRIGVSSTFRTLLEKRALEIYLSGKYLDLDQAVPGAVEFIQTEQARGAKVFFVSSRYDDVQRTGTLNSLQNLGLLIEGDRNEVILRARGMSSIEFKKKAFAEIRRWSESHGGQVELVMENEPENMNAMLDAFPGAMAVFVDGAWLKPEAVRPGPIHVRNFR